MKSFQLFRYLKKWMPLIVLFFVGMTVLAYQFLQRRQQYTAVTVIRYSNASDSSEVDVSEIYSSANMAKVVEALGPSSIPYSLDTLCASIQVTLVEPPEESSSSQAEEDEEPEPQPPVYIVRCTLDHNGSKELARDILNSLLDVYFSDYSSKHINLEQVSNQTKELINSDYDYLEMVENIDQQLSSTFEALNSRYLRTWDFRSADTGYSFADLRNEFRYLREVKVAQLYAQVLGNQITKDRQVLLNKYQNRIANYTLANQRALAEIDDVQEVIDSYVEKMRQSGNTNIDYNYILGEVYGEKWESGSLVDRTGEYDELLGSWVRYSNAADYAIINIAYCQYVIGIYRDGNTYLDTGSIPVDSGLEGGMPIFEDAQASATTQEVEAELDALLSRMNELYSLVDRTNIEYNEYLGAQAIQILSTTSAAPTINMRLYVAVIGVFFLLVGCCGAVLLGRTGDILEYLFLKDRLTGCMNRLSCDNYIRNWEKRALSPEMCCLHIQITNQREMNESYGRETVDHAMQEFGRVLRELFESRKDSFVGYNGSGQFWVFYQKGVSETVGQEVEYLSILMAQTLQEVLLQYQVGAANAGELGVFQLRGLISCAVKNSRAFTTAASAQQEVVL